MTVQREMPRYQCYKRVWALKIKNITEGKSNDEFAYIHFENVGYAPILVNSEWYFKHKPQSSGYYVVYEDGYRSFSPANAFESGYSLILPNKP